MESNLSHIFLSIKTGPNISHKNIPYIPSLKPIYIHYRENRTNLCQLVISIIEVINVLCFHALIMLQKLSIAKCWNYYFFKKETTCYSILEVIFEHL